MSLCERACLLPIRDEDFVPLVIEDLQVVVRPGAGYPVRVLSALMVAGAAREGNNGINAHLLCEQDGVAEVLVVSLGNLLVGVNVISVSAESGDVHAVLVEQCEEFLILLLIVQQDLGVAVRLSGISARAELERVDSEIVKLLK